MQESFVHVIYVFGIHLLFIKNHYLSLILFQINLQILFVDIELRFILMSELVIIQETNLLKLLYLLTSFLFI